MLIWIARACFIVAALLSVRSAVNIWGHAGGADNFLTGLIAAVGAENADGFTVSHARLHFGREALLAFGAVIGSALILFSPASARNGFSWAVLAVLLAAQTGGHWRSALHTGADPTPSATALQNHVGNAAFAALTLAFSAAPFFARRR